MRFHVISLPHTQTTSEYLACAFTVKVINFARMMTDLGHEVFLYAGDKNEAPCTEHIACISEESRAKACGGNHFSTASFNNKLAHWQIFNGNAIKEIKKRAQPKDFICVIGGGAHKPIADAFPNMITVEFGIGYGGTFAKYRVWESYAWMHTCYGAATGGNANAADGVFFDAVIPGYFDPEVVCPYEEQSNTTNVMNEEETKAHDRMTKLHNLTNEPYYLFVGRLIDRKGYKIAADVCQHLGVRLIVAGEGTPPDYGDYVGMINAQERRLLMSRATALFVPTLYIEPFGNVAVEAMACGTPVISTDWGAMTETVINGVTGYRCRTFNDFCEAAEKVKTLDSDFIRNFAVSNYSLDVIGKKYEDYFTRLLTLWGKGWYELKGEK